MTRLRLILLSMLAVFAVSAVASASASAASKCEAKEEGGDNTWCIEGKELAGEQALTTSQKTSFVLTAAAAGITLTCTKETGSGTLVQVNSTEPAASDVELTFSGCTLTSLPNCKVKEPIKVNGGGDLLDAVTKGRSEVTFTPSEGETFAEITIENNGAKTCLQKGTFPVTGSQTCALPKGEEEITKHEVECKTTGSKLKLGKNEATFSGTAFAEVVSVEVV